MLDISLFNTTLGHTDRSRVVIPSRKIVGEILHNCGQIRRLPLLANVAYGTDIATALALVNEVLAVVKQLASEGMTLIMVTHEMRFAREVGDKLAFMHHGKVHEIGDPKALFAAPQTEELSNFIGSVNL